jgi:hypothetical protein
MDTLTKQWTEQIPQNIRPAKRPTFNPSSLPDAAMAAIRASLSSKAQMYVYATVSGCKVSWHKPSLPVGGVYYRIEAKSHSDVQCERWEV